MSARRILPVLAVLGAAALRGADEPWSFVPEARDAVGVAALVEPRTIGPDNVRLVGGPSPVPGRGERRRTVVVHFQDEPKPAAGRDEVPDGARWPGPDGRISLARPQGQSGAPARNPWIAKREAGGGAREVSFRCGGLVAGGQGAAFLNGRIVHVADLLSGYRVVRIAAAGAVVERDGAFYVLPPGRTTVLVEAGE